MQRAFRSLQHHCPPNFGVDLFDNNDFITIRINSQQLFELDHDNKVRALQYVFMVKEAFEDLGGIVLVVREPIKEDHAS